MKIQSFKISLLCVGFVLLSFVGCAQSESSSTASVFSSSQSDNLSSADTIVKSNQDTANALVTDIEGKSRNLMDFAWAQKYPTLLSDCEGMSDFIVETIAPENRIKKGTPLTYNFRDQQLTITVQNATKGADAEGIPTEKLQEAQSVFGALSDGEEYLTVSITIANTGSVESSFYLNNLGVKCCVDNTVAYGNIATEAVTCDLPQVTEGAKNQFESVLAAGESADYTVLFYVNSAIELDDLYLEPNFGGQSFSEQKAADVVLDKQWLALV